MDRVLYLVNPFETTSDSLPNPSANNYNFDSLLPQMTIKYKINKQEINFNHNFLLSGILRSF